MITCFDVLIGEFIICRVIFLLTREQLLALALDLNKTRLQTTPINIGLCN